MLTIVWLTLGPTCLPPTGLERNFTPLQRMVVKVALLLTSVLCCTLLPFARSSEDEMVSSVHLEDTWRTLTEADLRTELHLPRDSELLTSLPIHPHPMYYTIILYQCQYVYRHMHIDYQRRSFCTHDLVTGTAEFNALQ